MRIIQTADLWYKSGNSDKTYHLALGEEDGGYSVLFAYGRRGKKLIRGLKTTGPISESYARNIYRDVFDEKLGKGYLSRPGISGTVFVSDDPIPKSDLAIKPEENPRTLSFWEIRPTLPSYYDRGFLPDIREVLLS